MRRRVPPFVEKVVMIVAFLALVPEQRVSLYFKSRKPLTRSLVLLVSIFSWSVELFDMKVEF